MYFQIYRMSNEKWSNNLNENLIQYDVQLSLIYKGC